MCLKKNVSSSVRMLRAVHVGVRHDDDFAEAQLATSKSSLPMPVPRAVIMQRISSWASICPCALFPR